MADEGGSRLVSIRGKLVQRNVFLASSSGLVFFCLDDGSIAVLGVPSEGSVYVGGNVCRAYVAGFDVAHVDFPIVGD